MFDPKWKFGVMIDGHWNVLTETKQAAEEAKIRIENEWEERVKKFPSLWSDKKPKEIKVVTIDELKGKVR